MEQERLQLRPQPAPLAAGLAETLALRLEAVLSEQLPARDAFDADTPIDKIRAFLQDIIKVSLCGICRICSLFGKSCCRFVSSSEC